MWGCVVGHYASLGKLCLQTEVLLWSGPAHPPQHMMIKNIIMTLFFSKIWSKLESMTYTYTAILPDRRRSCFEDADANVSR